MQSKREHNIENAGSKYFFLLLIGSIRFFLCTVFIIFSKTSLYDTFEVLIKAYHTLETYLLPTIVCAALPIVFEELDAHRYHSKDFAKRAIVCTVLWIAATFVQIQFVKLGF